MAKFSATKLKAVITCHSNLFEDVLLQDNINVLVLPNFEKKDILINGY